MCILFTNRQISYGIRVSKKHITCPSLGFISKARKQKYGTITQSTNALLHNLSTQFIRLTVLGSEVLSRRTGRRAVAVSIPAN